MPRFDIVKKTVCAALLISCLLLCGCGNEKAQLAVTKMPVLPENVTENLTEIIKKPDFSPLAKEQFLLPEDDFSWEREFPPEYVMIHFTSAVVTSPENPYDLEKIRRIFEQNEVSINYIIDRDGSIFCWVPETRAAWHAGKGSFADDERLTNNMNRYSIGIELVGIGSENDMAQYLTPSEYRALNKEDVGFTDSQYTSLDALVGDICKRNNIPEDKEHVIGHDMYNPAKTDPGELFLWERIIK